MGGGAPGNAEFLLAGGGSEVGPSGGASATGGQLGGGATAGSTVDECDCSNETICPPLDYLRNEACGALESGHWLAQVWFEGCDLTVFEFGSGNDLGRYFYDSEGTLVGQLRGDLLELGFRNGCGVHCSTREVLICALCGAPYTTYPACES